MMPASPPFRCRRCTASLTSVFVARPTAVPAAATSAVSSTAMPVAASQPKKAEPIWMPPNCFLLAGHDGFARGHLFDDTVRCDGVPCGLVRAHGGDGLAAGRIRLDRGMAPCRRVGSSARRDGAGVAGAGSAVAGSILPGVMDLGVLAHSRILVTGAPRSAIFGACWAAHGTAHFH